jgi:hypothetical protein
MVVGDVILRAAVSSELTPSSPRSIPCNAGRKTEGWCTPPSIGYFRVGI